MVAVAPIPVSSNMLLEWVLISVGIVIVVGALGLILIQRARSRGRKTNRDLLLAMVLLWGLATCGSISCTVMQQMDWSSDFQQQLTSGYGDPSTIGDRPKLPIFFWAGLAAGYVGMIAWTRRRTP